MRVLILTQIFFPEPDFKALPLARRLLDEGHEVKVLTGFPSYPGGRLYYGYRMRPMAKETVEGVTVVRVPSFPSHNDSAFQRIVTYLSFVASCVVALPLLRYRPHAVYVYNLVTLVPVAVLSRWLWGSRIVLDVQDLWPDSVMASGMMGDTGAAKLLESLCNLSYRSPDVIVAQSPGFSRLLISRGVAPDRLRVVYNWAPNAIEPVVASNFAADGFFRIVYAGNVGKVQGLDILLEAAAILKETHPTVRFIIVGSGTEYERLRLRSVGSSNVEFRERIPPDEVIPILTGAAALLLHLCDLPLFRTTIPSKLQQYLQVGRPILCGIDGDASDLVNEAGAGISFTPGSAESLVNAVQKLMAMPEENRDAMGKSGALFYRRYLSQEHGIAKLSAALSGEASAVDSE